MQMIINIDVPELGPAIDFYHAALGLGLSRLIDDDVAELSGALVPIYLLAKVPSTVPASTIEETRQYRRHWTPVHIDFVVDDLEQAAQRAIDAGAVKEGECVVWRSSRCVTFSDPFGHGFCLIEFSGENYS